MSTALITGASRGFGRALAYELTARDWQLVLTARTEPDLAELGRALPGAVTVCGDIGDAVHREALAAAAEVLAPVDLLVNNASDLGPSPLPPLATYEISTLRTVFETNVFAPIALTQLLLPSLNSANGTVVNMSSDAAVEPYPGWGGYGSSKAALDQLSAVLGVEKTRIRVYAFDPGDMRTDMHQRAFPGEDISDRPEPESVVPALLALLEQRPPSGRYRAADYVASAVAR